MATISLSNTPIINAVTYLSCDYPYTASLAPSGNWYIPTTYWVYGFPTSTNTLFLKANMNNLVVAEWDGLADIYVYLNTRMDEISNCNMRVAG